MHFAVSVNGHYSHRPADTFIVGPGQSIKIAIELTVPKHVTITALWFGISTGTYGFTQPMGSYGNVDARPLGIQQLLGYTRGALGTGRHTVTLQWAAPDHPARPAVLPIAADWTFTSPLPPFEGAVAGPIAQFAVGP